ncbi:MAG: CoA transferase [Rhodospirillales bacterium]|nr:CoA transferase [Rhodospirillales bacterium]
MAEAKSEGALSGIRVIDLTRVLAGPFCTMNLGDMGAEIIKVERPGSGDDTRAWGPPFAGTEAAYFLGVNRNKRSVTLNLKDPRGLDILKKMLTQADVLIENFKTGTLDRWGITAEWLEQNAPQVVHCQITGYGDRGPKGGMPGYDFLLQAESGLMSITGDASGGPMKLGVAIVDVCTGMYAAMCVTAAIAARARTGRGQKVSVTLFDTSLSMLVNVASNYLISTKPPGRFGNGHPNIVPYREFPCGQGEIALAIGNDNQFAQLAKALDHPEWAADDRFKTNAARVGNRETIDALIQDALSGKSAKEWIATFEALSIPCSMVNTVEQALESEQAKANKMVEEVDHPTAGMIRMLGIPYEFSDTKAKIKSAPPILGADTDDVLKTFVGLNADEILALRSGGVI